MEEGPAADAAITAISLTELHFGVLVAGNDAIRADRVRRLGLVEGHFDPLPFDAAVGRECGRLHAAVAQRGGRPRGRAFDLAIAATANVHGVALLTYNTADFQIIEDLVAVRAPR